MWHANPHLASFACGGSSAKLLGMNVSDAALQSNAAHPHPPLSAKLWNRAGDGEGLRPCEKHCSDQFLCTILFEFRSER
jgi:hypothetical protein